MRRVSGLFLAALTAYTLVLSVAASGQTAPTAEEVIEECHAILHDSEGDKRDRCDAVFHAYFDSLTTTTTSVSTTTTTAAPTTTTTAPEPLPEPSGDRFVIENKNLDTGEPWWNAPYFRNLPFTAGVGWTDGDRIGYGCAYMFLERDGEIVGRTSFVQVPGTTYVKINDRFMDEGVRWFDGSLYLDGNAQVYHVSFCETIVDQAYEPSAVDERPDIRFVQGGDLLEVRDYKQTEALHPGLTFGQGEIITDPFQTTVHDRDGNPQTDWVYGRIPVVAYENDLPVIVVYYDSLDPSVSVVSDLP